MTNLPWAETPDTIDFRVALPLKVVANKYDEDNDVNIVQFAGFTDGDSVTIRVPPSSAQYLPLGMELEASLTIEVPE